MNFQHKNLLESGRWFEMNIFEQLANIGVEVGRAINWKNKGNQEYSRLAFERSLELLYFTIEDKKNRDKLGELCRLKEVLGDYFMGENQYKSSAENLNKYFYPYNYAARVISNNELLKSVKSAQKEYQENLVIKANSISDLLER